MIKDSELRKGNYVYFNPNGRPFVKRIKELREQDLICCGEDNPDQQLALFYTNCDVEPIPLTPEWLERCGIIEKESSLPGKLKFTGEGNFTIEAVEEGKLKYYLPFNKKIEVKYLHQLQNLYFALTGEELTIKQPA